MTPTPSINLLYEFYIVYYATECFSGGGVIGGLASSTLACNDGNLNESGSGTTGIVFGSNQYPFQDGMELYSLGSQNYGEPFNLCGTNTGGWFRIGYLGSGLSNVTFQYDSTIGVINSTTCPTPTPSTTPTPSITPTLPIRTVTLYGALTNTGLPIKFQYSLDGGATWNDAGDYFDDTLCDNRGGFTIVSGNSASIRAWDGANQYFFGRVNNSTTCPGSPYTTCTGLVSNVTSDRNIAITVDVLTQC
jgi:hypothetical protein